MIQPRFISDPKLPHDELVISPVPSHTTQLRLLPFEVSEGSRDYVLCTPACQAKDCILMGLPRNCRSFVGETPTDDPAVSISGEESAVAVSKAHGMDLAGVAS